MKKLSEEEKKKLRKEYISFRKGDLTSFASMLAEEFRFRVHCLSQLVGSAHEPSLGSYKENLLKEFLIRFLPKRYNVGTGFILFSKENHLRPNKPDDFDLRNLKRHYISKQLDIIIYDNTNYPVVFSDGDFVIVRPESVQSVIEVKGFLDSKQVANFMDLFIDLGKKWSDNDFHYKNWGQPKLKEPAFFVMAWNVSVDKEGKARTDGKRIRKQIVRAYKKEVSINLLKRKNFPLLNGVFIYDDCCVEPAYSIGKNGVERFSYFTDRGKFVRYDDDGKPTLSGDKTLSTLLAFVYVNLDTPFNPLYSYVDQSNSTNLFQHEHFGETVWLEGKETDYARRPIDNCKS